jgi:hypothetical protein
MALIPALLCFTGLLLFLLGLLVGFAIPAFASPRLGVSAHTTGRSLPIAGGGKPAKRWQERFVQTVLAIGGIGTTAATAAILILWHWAGA